MSGESEFGILTFFYGFIIIFRDIYKEKLINFDRENLNFSLRKFEVLTFRSSKFFRSWNISKFEVNSLPLYFSKFEVRSNE